LDDVLHASTATNGISGKKQSPPDLGRAGRQEILFDPRSKNHYVFRRQCGARINADEEVARVHQTESPQTVPLTVDSVFTIKGHPRKYLTDYMIELHLIKFSRV
jgi:hypothetical protein